MTQSTRPGPHPATPLQGPSHANEDDDRAVDTARPLNAYTDSPALHPHLVVGSLQLLAWLWFHPAAWWNCLVRLQPPVSSDTALASLGRAYWRSPALCRLLLQSFLIPLVLVLLIEALCLLPLGVSAQNVVLAVFTNMGLSLVAGVLVGLTTSLEIGLVAALIGGLGIGVAHALTAGLVQDATGEKVGYIITSNVANVAPGLGIPVAFSNFVILVYTITGAVSMAVIAASVSSLMASSSPARPGRSVGRHIGGLVIGLVVSSFTVLIDLVVRADLTGSLSNGIVYGLWYGGIAGLACHWRVRRWRASLATGVGIGLLSWGVVELATRFSQALPRGLLTLAGTGALNGAGVGLWLSSAIILPYVLVRHLAGPWAGIMAGGLGVIGVCLGWVVILELDSGASFPWRMLGLAGLLILSGMVLVWLRPILLYPILSAWNLALQRADEGRRGGSSYLRWHPAFWDEHQRLPWFGLDDHLLLVLERAPAEGQMALEYVARSRQHWAAQSAQIEMDARQLERCRDVHAIGHSHLHLAAGDLIGPASSLLRSFSRLGQDVTAALQQTSAYNQRLALSAVQERLDGLLRELTRSSERYALRFRPVAVRWSQVIGEHLRTLAKTAEQRQEIPSPYVIGLPLTVQQTLFVGRTEVSARLETLLLDPQCPPMLLYGQRRMGKTSLLNNLERLLPSTLLPLFVDLQGPVAQARDHAGLLAMLARTMTESARRQRESPLPSLPRQELAADPFPRFEQWLDEVESALAGLTLLLTLDEFEALERALAEGRFSDAAVLGTLRHMIQHRPRFRILLAGSHTLEEVERWAGYLINTQVVRLSYLSEGEACQLIERPVQDFPLRYEEDARRRVLTLTRGHPALVQLLCAEIIALKNTQSPSERRLARLADVEAAVPEALHRGTFFFSDIRHNQVEANALRMVGYLAAQGEGAVVAPGRLLERYPEGGDGERALQALVRRELIEPAGEGYRFQVELIRRWFAAG